MKKASIITPSLLLIFTVVGMSAQSPKTNSQSRKRQTSRKVIPCLTRVPSPDELAGEVNNEWLVATTNTDEIYYYNTRKMTCEAGVLKVWVKTELVGDNAKHSMIRYEVNCHRNQMRTMAKTDYDRAGNVVGDFTSEKPKWEDVVPDSLGEGILETVCHKKL